MTVALLNGMSDVDAIRSRFRICKLSIGDGSRLNLNGDSVSSYVELEGIDPLLSPFCFFDIFYSFYIVSSGLRYIQAPRHPMLDLR